ncbi:SSI family serine proteinase inhibitor [Streptomyces sp. MP131-18]|uniref:SSI family serine proteinase inhibitor n=1 Tax=Streptomyces sp. MP131-18 TaxID=1857892 RepID=UPI00097C7E67|nr:SSI family serine proteinase inhibitor [Streptomyces sp. MP131-18]ONK12701.1 Kexstatin I [Streptomyces sp. MP131-18]
MLHKSLVAALALVASAAVPAAAVAGHAPEEAANRLVITVADSGTAADGTHELICGPAGGDHPDPAGACEAVERADRPFDAVAEDALCTYVHGGPATAEIEGVWNGERVRATFSRVDGCEIARWDALVPALPEIGA